ncbi:MAG: ABC transporter ATP-binding protein [Desulfobacteraceae bacterium]|nr:ABC transporter ATP-binding protein [Desulfobacteraceae bacterium]
MDNQTEHEHVLQINGLQTYFNTPHGMAKAVDGIDLTAKKGEIIGLVGESGCGKSALAMSVMQLLPVPPTYFAGGEILFKNQNILSLTKEEVRKLRGNQISMIFQEPMTALNPVFTIGNQLSEVFRVHQGMNRRQAFEKAVEMLDMVGVPSPEQRIREYPYQLSGGMRQRVMIAMALSCRPALLLADEPTTALDVTIQAQILDLMLELREELEAAIILITHDLGVVAETTERVAVMYTGRIVEEASTLDLFNNPLHPYTRGLMEAIPSAEAELGTTELNEIEGTVPSLLNLPDGCNFAPRCSIAGDICLHEDPALKVIGPGHKAACFMVDHD